MLVGGRADRVMKQVDEMCKLFLLIWRTVSGMYATFWVFCFRFFNKNIHGTLIRQESS